MLDVPMKVKITISVDTPSLWPGGRRVFARFG
jgi:hypothetical protein